MGMAATDAETSTEQSADASTAATHGSAAVTTGGTGEGNGTAADGVATETSVAAAAKATFAVDAAAAEKQARAGDTPEEKRSAGKTALLMFALCMAVFLAALDTTIITTALPTISAHFQTTQADYSWIGSSYLLAAAASTPLWGKFSDIWGRKAVLLVANVVFFVGSLVAALSTSIGMLLAGRVVQGLGGGGLLILVNICISDLFSMRTRGMYYGMVGGTWAVAAAIGPILGGVFTEKVSFRWCFYINLPCDGLAFIILLLFLDIQTPTTPLVAGLRAIDWLGSLTIAGGTVMLLLGLAFGGVSFAWSSATVVCLIVFGILTIALFFVNEWRLPLYPIMPLRLFGHRSNLACLAVCACHGFTFISGSYFLPLYFQAVLGATPLLSGVYLFPFVIPLALTSAGTGIFIRKTGAFLPPIWFGMFFLTLGFGLYLALPARADWPRIVLFQVVAGVGVGPNFQAPLIALQSHVRHPQDVAAATAAFGFVRNVSTSIAVVVGSVVFQNRMEAARAALVAAGLDAATVARLAGGAAGASTGLVAALPPRQRDAARDAYTAALARMWIVFVCVGFVGLGLSLCIDKRELSKRHSVTRTGLEAMERGRKEGEAVGTGSESGSAGGSGGKPDADDVEKA